MRVEFKQPHQNDCRSDDNNHQDNTAAAVTTTTIIVTTMAIVTTMETADVMITTITAERSVVVASLTLLKLYMRTIPEAEYQKRVPSDTCSRCCQSPFSFVLSYTYLTWSKLLDILQHFQHFIIFMKSTRKYVSVLGLLRFYPYFQSQLRFYLDFFSLCIFTLTIPK